MGTGTDRGLALLFTVAGMMGLTVTLFAMRSNAYRSLSKHYEGPNHRNEPQLFEAQNEKDAPAEASD